VRGSTHCDDTSCSTSRYTRANYQHFREGVLQCVSLFVATYARTLPTAYSKHFVVLLTLQVIQVQLLLDSLSTHPGGCSCLFTLHVTVQVIKQCVYWRTYLFIDILQSNMYLQYKETHIVFVTLSSMFVLPGIVRLLHQNGCCKLLVALQDERCFEV
jgi:hypothetical protein